MIILGVLLLLLLLLRLLLLTETFPTPGGDQGAQQGPPYFFMGPRATGAGMSHPKFEKMPKHKVFTLQNYFKHGGTTMSVVVVVDFMGRP